MTSAPRPPHPGAPFPDISVPKLGGGELALGKPERAGDWRLLVVYRGKHCPLCHRYLAGLQELAARAEEIGVALAAVSGDPEPKARAFVDETGVTFPVGYDLSLEQMQALGLYVSDPRSPQETDRPFPEPAVFVVNGDGAVQILDLSNAPFARPDLAALLNGIAFVREKDYPIRGRRLP
ncbi:peroxiredoxin-like family protein [Albimonas sp. CAU 1670]|uniref:peroxiredoxin-like family protein n=1 Tax=Albimonas sp. CAU 1670 TaxID=3032599 RepID=UPI0023DC0771|nr:peroxiredoxin-like family protein [Albimonas sp. CAU 1670]MDF2231138.1 peroxiredoxin-like family protein [Albimonas sp. CAU 1670]